MSLKSELKIPLHSDELIRKQLPKMFKEVDLSTPASEGLKLSERELFFRLGQASVVKKLTELLDHQIKTQGE